MRKWVLGLALIALPAAALNAQMMPVATFVAKAEALGKKGPLALLSKDMRLLKAEITASAKIIRAENQVARKQGRSPDNCLPEKASLNSDELITYLKAIPAARQPMPLHEGFRGFVRKKFPCTV